MENVEACQNRYVDEERLQDPAKLSCSCFVSAYPFT